MEIKPSVRKRLESVLIEMVEKWSKQCATAEEVEALAAVAKVLADMQKG